MENAWKSIYRSIIATGLVFSWSFSKSPWSKNSSATNFATLCWTSHGFAIALTSQAVIIIPHSTGNMDEKIIRFIFVCCLLNRLLWFAIKGNVKATFSWILKSHKCTINKTMGTKKKEESKITYNLFSPRFANRIHHFPRNRRIFYTYQNRLLSRLTILLLLQFS